MPSRRIIALMAALALLVYQGGAVVGGSTVTISPEDLSPYAELTGKYVKAPWYKGTVEKVIGSFVSFDGIQFYNLAREPTFKILDASPPPVVDQPAVYRPPWWANLTWFKLSFGGKPYYSF